MNWPSSIDTRSWWVTLCKNNDSSKKRMELIAEKLLLVCASQHSESLYYYINEWYGIGKKIKEARQWGIALWWVLFLSDDNWHRSINTVSWNKDVMKIWILAYTCQPHIWSPDPLWPAWSRMTEGHYPTSLSILWPAVFYIMKHGPCGLEDRSKE